MFSVALEYVIFQAHSIIFSFNELSLNKWMINDSSNQISKYLVLSHNPISLFIIVFDIIFDLLILSLRIQSKSHLYTMFSDWSCADNIKIKVEKNLCNSVYLGFKQYLYTSQSKRQRVNTCKYYGLRSLFSNL